MKINFYDFYINGLQIHLEIMYARSTQTENIPEKDLIGFFQVNFGLSNAFSFSWENKQTK